MTINIDRIRALADDPDSDLPEISIEQARCTRQLLEAGDRAGSRSGSQAPAE